MPCCSLAVAPSHLASAAPSSSVHSTRVPGKRLRLQNQHAVSDRTGDVVLQHGPVLLDELVGAFHEHHPLRGEHRDRRQFVVDVPPLDVVAIATRQPLVGIISEDGPGDRRRTLTDQKLLATDEHHDRGHPLGVDHSRELGGVLSH